MHFFLCLHPTILLTMFSVCQNRYTLLSSNCLLALVEPYDYAKFTSKNQQIRKKSQLTEVLFAPNLFLNLN